MFYILLAKMELALIKPRDIFLLLCGPVYADYTSAMVRIIGDRPQLISLTSLIRVKQLWSVPDRLGWFYLEGMIRFKLDGYWKKL